MGRVHNVLLDGHGEQDGLLLHEADLVSQPLRVELQDVDLVHVDGALLRVVEALDEVDDGALAAAAAADQRHCLAGGQLGVQPVEHLDLGAGGVVEVHVLELDVPFDAVGRDEAAVVVHLRSPAHGVK
jgi:hypothetical protein